MTTSSIPPISRPSSSAGTRPVGHSVGTDRAIFQAKVNGMNKNPNGQIKAKSREMKVKATEFFFKEEDHNQSSKAQQGVAIGASVAAAAAGIASAAVVVAAIAAGSVEFPPAALILGLVAATLGVIAAILGGTADSSKQTADNYGTSGKEMQGYAGEMESHLDASPPQFRDKKLKIAGNSAQNLSSLAQYRGRQNSQTAERTVEASEEATRT